MKLPEFNINSPKHLSLLLYGGKLEVETKQPVFNPDGTLYTFKTGDRQGQVKMQTVVKEVNIKGLGIQPKASWATKNEGVFQTNFKVLSLIIGERDED